MEGVEPADYRPTPRQLARAESDLEWWYGPRVSELGESAQSYDVMGTVAKDSCEGQANTATGLCGACAVCRIHTRAQSWRRSRAVRKARQVAPRVLALGELRHVAAVIYTPHPYPVVLREVFPCVRTEPGVVTLVGVALRSGALLTAFQRAHDGKPPRDMETLQQWLVDAARLPTKPRWLPSVQQEAREARIEVLTAYVRR